MIYRIQLEEVNENKKESKNPKKPNAIMNPDGLINSFHKDITKKFITYNNIKETPEFTDKDEELISIYVKYIFSY